MKDDSHEIVPDWTAEIASDGGANIIVGSGLRALGDEPHGFQVGDYVTLVLRDGSRDAGVITEIHRNIISISRKGV